MLVSSVRAAHRSRCIKSGSFDAASPLQSAALLSHQLQQTRGFRFGWYRVSFGAPEPRPDDVYRRCRKFRYKYTSSVVQDTAPGRTVLIDGADSTSRRFGLWRLHGRVREHSHKAQGTGDRTITPENPHGVRPGQNIEDVERAPMESLIFGTDQQSRGNIGGTPLPDSEAAFTIDPITNRKVYGSPRDRLTTGSPSDVAGFSKSNKPDFDSLRPPRIDEPRSRNPSDAPPILESDQYLADLAGFPTAQDILGVKEKDVSWHPAEGLAASPTSPQGNRHGHSLDHQVLNHRSRKYDDLHKYGSVDFAEPAGKIAPGAWEQSHTQQYEDVGKYGAVRFHEPDGKYKETSEPSVDSSEVKKYKPVRSHEPDGKYQESPDSTQHTGELREYRPFRSHEPDGRYKRNPESTVDVDELKDYKPFRSHEPDGKYKERSEPTRDTSELEEYQPFRSHEPDGKYKKTPESTVDENELDNYKPFRSHEPDGKYRERPEPTTGASELKNYKPFRSHEPDGKYKQDSEFSVEPSELAKYQPFRAHEPDGMYAVAHNAQPDSKKDYPDLEWYNHGLFSHEPDGKYASARNEAVEERADVSSYGAFRGHEPDGKYSAEAAKPTPSQALDGESFGYDLKGLEASGATPEEKTYYRQMLESLMARSAEDPKAEKIVLTGNYVRDFPEEFSRRWVTGKDSNPALLPSDIEETGTSDVAPTQAPSNQPGDLQPALDRYSNTKGTDLPPATISTTLYKVLVYDPVMQRIDTAETTSIVPDNTAPLTPAEVLLRVSNPAKFMPHFGPLQAQGFEIVSGAGDVLVFRKVRDAGGEATADVSDPAAPSPPPTPAINPIDMTGQGRGYYTAAERFASPTGFVNYDLPPSSERVEQPVRRVEPVFSGPKEDEAGQDKAPEEGKSVPKRLAIGAAWVAGVSYSIGVVGEYLGKGE